MWWLRTAGAIVVRSWVFTGFVVVGIGALSFGLGLSNEVVTLAWSENSVADDASSHAPQASRKAEPTPGVLRGEDYRGEPDLIICSQNLKLFGTYAVMKARAPGYKMIQYESKVEDLVARFKREKCDVIAVQEVMGKREEEQKGALAELAKVLRRDTGRVYESRVAPPADGAMTTGFMVATDRAEILQTFSYSRVELPRIDKKQKPRSFSRTPLEIQLAVTSRDGEIRKMVSIVNFHLKSKRGGEGDPTGLEWETYRMEMSEALRRILESRHKDSFASGESILVVLGDRNSNFDVASARILEGSLTLGSFIGGGPCRLSKRGVPLCKAESEVPRKLFSVITSNKQSMPQAGTFSYKGEYSWLDDIMMPAESLHYAWMSPYSESIYNAGAVYTPQDASDHAMLYVKLNW
jgi:endonuclease/exonuclease/phosphatase family metal-dependent hydrolase